MFNPDQEFRFNRAVQAEALERARYVATVNVPGYLPMDDEPPVFESTREAWEYLVGERERGEDETSTDVYSDVVEELRAMSGLGTVYGSTPGSDSEHDLGLAYCVDLAEEVPCEHFYVMVGAECPVCGVVLG